MATAQDEKTSVRWEAANAVWLRERAVELRRVSGGRVGVGTVVQAVVTRARLEWEAAHGAPAALGSTAGSGAGRAEVEGLRALVTGAAGTVGVGAASVPPSGAAPRVRLDVVVARVLAPGAGRITPVDRARALRAIKEGRVRVDGHDGPLEAGMHVSPGAVVVS